MARTRQPEVSNDIRRLITQIRALLGKGEELPSERVLAGQLDVNRHRLRLALDKMREASELPRPAIRRNDPPILKGDVVVQETNALEVIELRMVLEPAIARLAAIRASPVQIAKILEAATTPSGVARSTGDIAFHKLLADSSGNQLAASFMRSCATSARTSACIFPPRRKPRGSAYRCVTRNTAQSRKPLRVDRRMRPSRACVSICGVCSARSRIV